MTSVLPEEDGIAVKIKRKIDNHQQIKEESRSFLSFSRENLSISQSDLEQGFNKHRFRPKKTTILSVAGLVIALLCLGLEIWELRCALMNAREIEELKRDIDTLKHRFLEEDLLDELKAFEEQLYAEGSNDEDDSGEADIDNADYDTNYEDDSSSSHDCSGDYHASPTYGSRSIDFPDGTVTSGPMPTPPEPETNNAHAEILAALRKAEAKKGQELEYILRENHKSIERDLLLAEYKKRAEVRGHEDRSGEKNGTRRKRDVSQSRSTYRLPDVARSSNSRERVRRKRFVREEDELTNDSSAGSVSSHQKGSRNRTKDAQAANLHVHTEEGAVEERNLGPATARERHPPKKYHAHARQEMTFELPSSHDDDDLSGQFARSSRRPDDDPENVASRRSNRRKVQGSARGGDIRMHRLVQDSERAEIPSRRGLTKRHLRAPRQVYAAHYGLFTAPGRHNGKIHHEGTFKGWRPSDWVLNLSMDRYFSLAYDGKLTVHEPGLYLAYAQIHYMDIHDETGFHMLVNNETLLQCTSYSPLPVETKSRSCFSAQVTVLQTGDSIELAEIGASRHILFVQEKSFFGLVKLGDIRPQQKHTTQPSS